MESGGGGDAAIAMAPRRGQAPQEFNPGEQATTNQDEALQHPLRRWLRPRLRTARIFCRKYYYGIILIIIVVIKLIAAFAWFICYHVNRA